MTHLSTVSPCGGVIFRNREGGGRPRIERHQTFNSLKMVKKWRFREDCLKVRLKEYVWKRIYRPRRDWCNDCALGRKISLQRETRIPHSTCSVRWGAHVWGGGGTTQRIEEAFKLWINLFFNHYFMRFLSSLLPPPLPVSIRFFRALCACHEERGRRNPPGSQ